MLTQEYVKILFKYDSETGDLFRKERPRPHFKKDNSWKRWNNRFANKSALSIDKDGYRIILIDYRPYRVHRIAFLWMNGRWPKEDVDHKDGNRLNNKWENLREATRSQNNYNSKIHKNNTSGFKGVGRQLDNSEKWFARINYNKRIVHLGTYNDYHFAVLARLWASEYLHSEFMRHI